MDTDSDNDGIPDLDEEQNIPALSGIDSDGDGIDDALDVDQTGGTDANGDGVDDALSPSDLDGDGIADYLDGDTDGDGIADATEGAGDTDSDGMPNYRDLDSDSDGIPDELERFDSDGDGADDGKRFGDGHLLPLADHEDQHRHGEDGPSGSQQSKAQADAKGTNPGHDAPPFLSGVGDTTLRNDARRARSVPGWSVDG